MWMGWGLWLVIVGIGLILGFLSIRSARRARFRNVRNRKILSSREGIVNFGVSKDKAESWAFSSVSADKAELAVRAACLRARWASDVFNAVSEECFLDAILRAKAIDQEASRAKPLAGMPFTVSDSLAAAGMESTVGMFERLGDGPYEDDCAPVAAMRAAGGVLICKSAVSTGSVNTFDTCSPLVGATINPWGKSLVVPGPDGGGAVLCSVGVGKIHLGLESLTSAVAVGVPAFRFSPERSSLQGKRPAPGPPSPISFIAREVDTLVEGASVVLEPVFISRNDPLIVPMPFDRDAYLANDKLVIGVPSDSGWHEDGDQTLEMVKHVLSKFGHEVTDFPIGVSLRELIILRTGLMTAEKLREIPKTCDLFNSDPFVRTVRFWLRLPGIFRKAIAPYLESKTNRKALGWILRGIEVGVDPAQYPRLLKRKNEIRAALVQRMVKNGVDALIVCGKTKKRRQRGMLSIVDMVGGTNADLSILDLPVGVIPVSSIGDQTDPESSAETVDLELPSYAQVAVPPWQDELCLMIMRELEKKYGWIKPNHISDSFRRWNGPLPGGALAKEALGESGESTPLLAR